MGGYVARKCPACAKRRRFPWSETPCAMLCGSAIQTGSVEGIQVAVRCGRRPRRGLQKGESWTMPRGSLAPPALLRRTQHAPGGRETSQPPPLPPILRRAFATAGHGKGSRTGTRPSTRTSLQCLRLPELDRGRIVQNHRRPARSRVATWPRNALSEDAVGRTDRDPPPTPSGHQLHEADQRGDGARHHEQASVGHLRGYSRQRWCVLSRHREQTLCGRPA